jgi:hypothetical protein
MYKIKWFFLSIVVLSSMGCATAKIAPCPTSQEPTVTQVESSFFQSTLTANPGVGPDELSSMLGKSPTDTVQITPSTKYQIYQTYVMSSLQQFPYCTPVSLPTSHGDIAVYFKDGKMVGQSTENGKYSDLKNMLQLGAITQDEYDSKYTLFQKDDQIASQQQIINQQQQQLQQQEADQQQADYQQQQLQQQQQAQQQADQERNQQEKAQEFIKQQNEQIWESGAPARQLQAQLQASTPSPEQVQNQQLMAQSAQVAAQAEQAKESHNQMLQDDVKSGAITQQQADAWKEK